MREFLTGKKRVPWHSLSHTHTRTHTIAMQWCEINQLGNRALFQYPAFSSGLRCAD